MVGYIEFFCFENHDYAPKWSLWVFKTQGYEFKEIARFLYIVKVGSQKIRNIF
jgi:hypothetical protein